MEHSGFEVELVALEDVEDFFEGMTEEQVQVMKSAYMVMLGYAWLLYEKEDGWYIAVKQLDDLEKVLWTKIRVVGWPCEEPVTAKKMYIDFKDTNFDEKTKFELLYYTERNRDLLLDVFPGKFEADDSEEFADYKRWVIQE